MSGSSITALIERWLGVSEPGARIVRMWPLDGGISATMTAFEIESPDGSRKKRIARQPNRYEVEANPEFAKREFRVLSTLKAAGLAVQTPYHMSEPPEPFLILEYVEGQVELNPSDPSGFLRRYAEQLAKIHRVDLDQVDLSFLPRQGKGYGAPRETLNEVLREGEIRAALRPPVHANPAVLRHGDFWPGNVVWRDGEIAAVVDWEEALIGEPLADLAICRLDLWWILGREAASEFTERYRTLVKLDLSDLSYWDLCAALRPIANIGEWAAAYPKIGRPDITEATMSRDHQEFVEQALRSR